MLELGFLLLSRGVLELAGVGYFSSPGQLGCDITPGRLGPGTLVLVSASLVRTECSGLFQNGSFSPPPAWKPKGICL